MIILTGPSASGKTATCLYLQDHYGIKKVITHTTRPMRHGEVNDVDYHFVSKEEFQRMIDNDEFVEHVTFNGNGATSGAMAAQSFTYGVAKNLSANAFQKTGHDFKGWATAQGGAVLYADGAQFSASADVTLWAVWEPKTFTIRFLMNDGTATVLGSQQFTYGVSVQLDAPMPTREGYTLAGWAETANGGVAYVGGETVTFEDDTDLYAVWSAGLGAALAGTESLVWRTGGDAPWTGVAIDGEDVARSGAISDDGFTYVATDVTGPGRLMFRWKVSSESYRDYQIDYLTFSVDDEEMDWIGGEVGWTECTFDLNEGPHTLTWTYFKDEVDFDGEDCAWLDSVFFLHSSGVSFAAPDATSGSVPSAIEGWENDEVMLPAAGDLRRAKHEFAGWTDGIATYSPGGAYILPPAAATLSAVWTAKVVATERAPRFLTFVTPTVEKGLYFFLGIARELGERRPDIPILLVEGRGKVHRLAMIPEARKLTNLNVLERVESPALFFKETRLLLVPSLCEETFGRVVVEAGLNGIPALCSDRGRFQKSSAIRTSSFRFLNALRPRAGRFRAPKKRKTGLPQSSLFGTIPDAPNASAQSCVNEFNCMRKTPLRGN